METKLKRPELVQGVVSRYSYDAVDVPAEGGKEAGGAGTNVRKLIVALEQTDHKGVAAHWIFGRDHHSRYGRGYREIPIIQYTEPHSRGFQVIWPEHRAASTYHRPPGERGNRRAGHLLRT